jgi:hypothetical protein
MSFTARERLTIHAKKMHVMFLIQHSTDFICRVFFFLTKKENCDKFNFYMDVYYCWMDIYCDFFVEEKMKETVTIYWENGAFISLSDKEFSKLISQFGMPNEVSIDDENGVKLVILHEKNS